MSCSKSDQLLFKEGLNITTFYIERLRYVWRVILLGPVFFPEVEMSLAFSTTDLNGVAFCATPPETVGGIRDILVKYHNVCHDVLEIHWELV